MESKVRKADAGNLQWKQKTLGTFSRSGGIQREREKQSQRQVMMRRGVTDLRLCLNSSFCRCCRAAEYHQPFLFPKSCLINYPNFPPQNNLFNSYNDYTLNIHLLNFNFIHTSIKKALLKREINFYNVVQLTRNVILRPQGVELHRTQVEFYFNN